MYLVFDGTESMDLSDDYSAEKSSSLALVSGADPADATRRQLLHGWLGGKGAEWSRRLADKGVRIEAFTFDGQNTSRLRRLRMEDGAAGLAVQLKADGHVTELGAVLEDLQQQLGASRLAGVIMFSDFAHNGSTALLGNSGAVSRIKVPVHTVGLGAAKADDVYVELQTDPTMKRAERTILTVRLSQSGLAGQAATVVLSARPLRGDVPLAEIGRRPLTLQSPVELLEFPYTPDASGEFEFEARVLPLETEANTSNNRFVRRTKVVDDYLRLMYVAFEPTWEWHFLKEVFHRDKLVGMDGFRTFLSSSDPKVRQANVLFMPALTPRRSEFFANDVIFLDDMPRAAVSDRFAEMTEEFVGEHGGGLVVIAGPRFGPRQLVGTRLADMLPVLIDPNAKLQHESEFLLQRTPHAARHPFMVLGESAEESQKAWENLGKLPFYQPVLGLHEQAISLAEHPTDVCQDGRTKQPLIAIRPYGRGQVVYLGFNETWRLRRRHGEKYYRRLWSQLIYRLGMSHSLGADKRFRVFVNGQQFRPDDEVTLVIEAYDENFEPLDPSGLPGGVLEVRWRLPEDAGGETRELTAAYLRQGVYETRFPVFQSGEHSLSVIDPVTKQTQQRRFEVLNVSAEHLRVVRDEQLQRELAEETGGFAVDLADVAAVSDAISAEPAVESLTRDYPLWAGPAWFGLLMALMLGEWLTRKLVHLS